MRHYCSIATILRAVREVRRKDPDSTKRPQDYPEYVRDILGSL